jgi:hypothetical protein
MRTVGLVAVGFVRAVPGSSIPSGDFARVDFDCVPGAARPTLEQFSYSAEASSEFGALLTTDCSLRLVVDP